MEITVEEVRSTLGAMNKNAAPGGFGLEVPCI